MKFILVLSSFLVCANALPTYEDEVDRNDPQNYKNIEILILESAVDQDGGYSFSFENDDGSKVAQEGQQGIGDDERTVERIRGSYSYNDVNGQPVSLTYTADENGFRPVGAHLPTPPPVPLEILRSLKFLATAKPFVDEQLYDYKPKKKVFRGRQYNTGTVVPRQRSRNNLRSSSFSQPMTEETPSEVILKSVENHRFAKQEMTSEANPEAVPQSSSETIPESSSEMTLETTSESAPTTPDNTDKPAVESAADVVNESKKKINEALKEAIEKTSKITQQATQETANAAITAVREEASKLTDTVKVHVNKINEKLSGTSAAIDTQVSVPAKQSRQVIDEYASSVSDAVSTADEALDDIAAPIDLHVRIN